MDSKNTSIKAGQRTTNNIIDKNQDVTTCDDDQYHNRTICTMHELDGMGGIDNKIGNK